MPPAFNLSQDQTLQFKPSGSHTSKNPSRYLPAPKDRFLTVQALQCLKSSQQIRATHVTRTPATHATLTPGKPLKTPSTHTYRLRIVKERRRLNGEGSQLYGSRFRGQYTVKEIFPAFWCRAQPTLLPQLERQDEHTVGLLARCADVGKGQHGPSTSPGIRMGARPGAVERCRAEVLRAPAA